MLQKIDEMPPGCDGLRAVGTVSREDYQQTFEPMVRDAHRQGRRIRLLYQFGPDFDSFTPGAAWEDMRLGLHELRLFERIALVSDIVWLKQMTGFVGAMLPCPMKIFANDEWGQALSWLSSAVLTSGLKHHLLPESGVLVVEPRGPLSSQDFDAISLTVDPWIEAHGTLSGLVLHTADFPGWENLGSFLSHMRFVHDHHRKIQRVALVADGRFAETGPKLAEHFVKAEVKQFAYDRLDEALAWVKAASDASISTASPST